MNIEETDFAKSALNAAVATGAHLNMLESMIKAGKYHSSEVGKLLVELLCLTRQILDCVRPLQSTGEIHGLPKAASDPDRPEPIIFRKDNPAIDFGDWFEEKATRLHQAIFRIAKAVSTTASDPEAAKSLLNLNLAEADNLAATLADMLNSGGLVIREIRLGDDE